MPDSPVDAAHSAANAVQELNHATLTPLREGWESPGDAYDVVGALHETTDRLPQTINQVWVLLVRLAQEDMNSTRELSTDLKDTKDALSDAVTAAQQLTTALNRAHVATSALYLDT